MQLFLRKNPAKKKEELEVLAFLLPILVASSKYASQPVGYKAFNPDNLTLA